MINILDLYQEDITGKLISVAGGREYRGPCPGCGGEDRFGVFTRQNNGEGSFFCGRQQGGGKGCGKGGDAIAYLRAFRNMSYLQACRFLGKEPKGGGGKHFLYSTPRVPRQSKPETFVPAEKDYPAEVVNPELWQKKGLEFVARCHEALLARPKAIDYLSKRGISMQSILKYKLGFHEGATRKGQSLQMEFRPWPSWGLRDEKKAGGKHRCIKLVAGLVVPYIVGNVSIASPSVWPSQDRMRGDMITSWARGVISGSAIQRQRFLLSLNPSLTASPSMKPRAIWPEQSASGPPG